MWRAIFAIAILVSVIVLPRVLTSDSVPWLLMLAIVLLATGVAIRQREWLLRPPKGKK